MFLDPFKQKQNQKYEHHGHHSTQQAQDTHQCRAASIKEIDQAISDYEKQQDRPDRQLDVRLAGIFPQVTRHIIPSFQ
jgi:hypothetical protein